MQGLTLTQTNGNEQAKQTSVTNKHNKRIPNTQARLKKYASQVFSNNHRCTWGTLDDPHNENCMLHDTMKSLVVVKNLIMPNTINSHGNTINEQSNTPEEFVQIQPKSSSKPTNLKRIHAGSSCGKDALRPVTLRGIGNNVPKNPHCLDCTWTNSDCQRPSCSETCDVCTTRSTT